jgi:hypothetical protein
MRGLEGRKVGLALIGAQMLSLALAGASHAPAADGGAGRGAWPRVYTGTAFGPTLRWALDGAARRLESPRCQAVFAEFQDERGRPLLERLADLGVSGTSYLEWVIFYDGTGKGTCVREGVLAFTGQGHRVVYVCRERFEREWRAGQARFTEAVLIHEMLHTLGLGENPPSSQEITRRVLSLCTS